MHDREPPLLVHHPDPAADKPEEGVEAQCVGPPQGDPSWDRAVAVVAEEAEGVGAEQRGAKVAAEVEEELVVLDPSIAEIGHHAPRDVPAHAVDRPGLQPESVVLHVRHQVGGDHALTGERERVLEQAPVREAEEILRIYAIRKLEAGLDLQAAELRKRIAGQEEAAVCLLLIHIVERLVDESAVPAEATHAPVHPP